MFKKIPNPSDLQEFVILNGQPDHPHRLNVATTGEDKTKNCELTGLNTSRKWEYPEEFSTTL
jgi:hypothetical protein